MAPKRSRKTAGDGKSAPSAKKVKTSTSSSTAVSKEKTTKPIDPTAAPDDETLGPLNAQSKILEFNVHSILETILSHLPMQTLLLTQRTSRKFRNVITASIPLQQKLYLLPTPYTSFWKMSDGTMNPQADDDDESSSDVAWKKDPTMTTARFIATPINKLTHQFAMRINPLLFEPQEGSYEGICLRRDLLRSSEGASWRDMFLTQPPCKFLRAQDGGMGTSYFPMTKLGMGSKHGNVEGAKGGDAVKMLSVLGKKGAGLEMQDIDWIFQDGVEVDEGEETEGVKNICY